MQCSGLASLTHLRLIMMTGQRMPAVSAYAGKLADETARADAAEAGLAAITTAHEKIMVELDDIRKASSGEVARYVMVHGCPCLQAQGHRYAVMHLADHTCRYINAG